MVSTANRVRQRLSLKDCRVGTVWQTRPDQFSEASPKLAKIFFVKLGFVAYLHARKGNKGFSTRMADILKWPVFLALFEPRK